LLKKAQLNNGSIPILQIAHRLEVWGYTKLSLPPQAGIKSAQADLVCIAAISFSTGIFAKMGCTRCPSRMSLEGSGIFLRVTPSIKRAGLTQLAQRQRLNSTNGLFLSQN
jgi:hypothetical protein